MLSCTVLVGTAYNTIIDRARRNGFKLKKGRFRSSIRKKVPGEEIEQVSQWCDECPIPGDAQGQLWGEGALSTWSSVRDPVHAGGLDLMIFRFPSNSSDSLILWLKPIKWIHAGWIYEKGVYFSVPFKKRSGDVFPVWLAAISSHFLGCKFYQVRVALYSHVYKRKKTVNCEQEPCVSNGVSDTMGYERVLICSRAI